MAIRYLLPSILVSSKLRETRPMHREKPHKLLQVGVTPTPATILRLEHKLRREFQAKDVLHRLGEGGL